jgi:hypothetical protein
MFCTCSPEMPATRAAATQPARRVQAVDEIRESSGMTPDHGVRTAVLVPQSLSLGSLSTPVSLNRV